MGLVVGAVLIVVGGTFEYLAWLASQRAVPGSDRASEPTLRSCESAATGLGIAGGVLCLGGLAVVVSGLDNPFGVAALVIALVIGVVATGIAVVAAQRARRTS